MNLKEMLRKPFMCRKTLRRGWVAVNRNGKITWEYDPEKAVLILASRVMETPCVTRTATGVKNS